MTGRSRSSFGNIKAAADSKHHLKMYLKMATIVRRFNSCYFEALCVTPKKELMKSN